MIVQIQDIERFIQDWHWDVPSQQLALEMGIFLFGFLDYLEKKGASGRTLRKHRANVWHIGILTCKYGYLDQFSPDVFQSPPFQNIVFNRKMEPSAYALKEYFRTCRLLGLYVEDRGYKNSDLIQNYLIIAVV